MITFHRGTSRSVIAIPGFGIVIKFARIEIGAAWSLLRRAKRDHDRWCEMRDRESFRSFFQTEMFERTVEHNQTLKRFMCHGIVSNWRERSYYRSSDAKRRQLLQPTYFSFLGLVNIQKYGVPMKPMSLFEPKFGELYRSYFEVVGVDLSKDGHHFHEESNFHHTGERIMFLDYGSIATQRILTTYSTEILERFVPPDPRNY